ncbi:MAG: HlyD family secretion protein [Thermodesulfobacteriota bacterium]
MKVLKKALPVIALLALVLGLVFYLGGPHGSGGGSAKNSMRGTGTIEATEVALSPKIAQSIEWLCCPVGGPVKAGQVVARLDDRELKALVAEARATVAASVETINEAHVELEKRRVAVEAVGFELESARAEAARVESLAIDAEKEFKRISSLIKKGFVSSSDFDRVKAEYDSAAASFASARAGVKAGEAMLRSARVAVKRASAAVSAAEARRNKDEAAEQVLLARLAYAELKSPIKGVVAYKAFEAGEMSVPGKAIYTIYDESDMWARIDVGETELGRIRLGSRAEVSVAGLPERVFKGQVSEIGQMGEFATHKDVIRVSHDIKTFRVKVRLLRTDGLLKPGMTSRVRIFFDENKKNR